jgi:hypothetical protein
MSDEVRFDEVDYEKFKAASAHPRRTRRWLERRPHQRPPQKRGHGRMGRLPLRPPVQTARCWRAITGRAPRVTGCCASRRSCRTGDPSEARTQRRVPCGSRSPDRRGGLADSPAQVRHYCSHSHSARSWDVNGLSHAASSSGSGSSPCRRAHSTTRTRPCSLVRYSDAVRTNCSKVPILRSRSSERGLGIQTAQRLQPYSLSYPDHGPGLNLSDLFRHFPLLPGPLGGLREQRLGQVLFTGSSPRARPSTATDGTP